ncbi:heterokaryon incompatibility Het-C [Pseudomassariella vexata]|uniref:Heterokaryon incompatibility Het-C n=1 Tax=Pseudomassariella vexata TaxID=1141098 RepID=A0A1Y2DBR8_9PEZI|nr:heterokaryon incompatibility Het-C [Pseudomassariella vexata]ORY56566.1 heterokaryon incompatibility Het-C [Pseudomassariella vexata]
MPSSTHFVLVIIVCLLLLVGPASAFGAGEVPGSSEFKGYVWRHGDITEVIRHLPFSFITNHRFTQLQRKQIYFGNWLRDFSQVIDTTCLENVPEPILRAIVSVMGFMEFGFATDEFDVTRNRLGCYTHVEHIDNPSGYADNAKDVDERLRGPVDPRELETDPKTGMKNYIAKSGHGWATSTDYIRDQLEQCITLGRKGRHKDSAAQKESFIHLGAALHTLEDFSAHSNFTELCLLELGIDEVFAFVGDECRVEITGRTGRKVPPIVTGTFGMLDIFHSLLGEADDMAILQSKGSLGELEKKLNYGGKAFEQLFDLVKAAIQAVSNVSIGENPLLKQLETVGMIFKKAKEDSLTSDSGNGSGITNPNFLWQSIEPVFYLHDRISKWLQEGDETTNEPTSDDSNSQLGEYTNQLVYRFLGLMVESSVKELRNAVKAAKSRVDEEAAKANSAAVYEAGSSASDPSHSDLSKDHFSNVLNQPAGLVATVTTNWTTQQIVKCWDNPKLNANKTIDEILTILHHPAFVEKKTPIQQYMFETIEKWWRDNLPDEQQRLRSKLTKGSVQARGHENHKLTLKDIEGKHKGMAEFPGFRPDVQPPPKKISFPLSWAVNEAFNDFYWLVGTARKSMTDPRGAVVDVAKGTGGLVVNAVRMAITTPAWLARKTAGVATKLWPLGR